MAAALGSVLIFAGVGVGTAVPGTARAATADVATPPVLAWGPCGAEDGAAGATECATVEVPLDYTEPDGERIPVRISRLPASDPERRIGVLLMNPGGPGASGLDAPSWSDKVGDVRDRFDIIGFDPRGVGASSRLHCEPKPTTFEAIRPCLIANPRWATNLTTESVARDLDEIRKALGEERISFYGASWGASLGIVYRSLFDAHVDRMVVESLTSMPVETMTSITSAAEAGEAKFARFADYLAENRGRFKLGGSAEEASHNLDRIAEALSGRSLSWLYKQDAPPTTISAADVRDIAVTPWANRDFFARMIAYASEHLAESVPLDPPDDDQADLQSAQQDWVQFAAITCAETTRYSADEFAEFSRRLDADYPHGSAAAAGLTRITLCSDHPYPVTPPAFRSGHSPLQIIAHRGETVTPYADTIEARRTVGGGLLSIADDLHAQSEASLCAVAAMNAFWTTGTPTTANCSSRAGVGFAAPWDSTAAYEIGDKVLYRGLVYTCRQAHQGWGDPNWINAPSLWFTETGPIAR